jgi:c-di-AMP phosphodiesterase-like protein
MSRVKTSGALNKYLHLPLILTAVFILINAGVYLLNTRAGILVSGGLAIYIILILVIYGRQRENMLNDLVTFATQYGQVQRKLMMDLALPYAITDDRGKLLWFNDAFAELTGKDRKSFRKSIASIFNGMSPDKFPARDQEIEYETVYNRRGFRIQIKSIVLDDLIDNSQILERDDQE